jgi:uncharacterized protein
MKKIKLTREQVFEIIRTKLLASGAKKISLFGSYAKGEETNNSDIDVLVQFKETKSLLDIIGIEQDLSETLGIKVDLLTKGSISPHIMRKIQKENRIIAL